MASILKVACVMCTLTLGAVAVQSVSQKSAVQKVVEMLQEYKMKVAADLQAAEKEQMEYADYCDKEVSDKGYAIKTATRSMDDLNALLTEGNAKVQGADADIAKLGSEIAAKEDDLASLEKQRGTERGDFEATETELLASVEQVEKALVLVKRSVGGSALLQQKGGQPSNDNLLRQISQIVGSVVDSARIGHAEPKFLKGFLQQHDLAAADAEDTLQEALGHQQTAHGGDLAATLEDMKTKAEETLSAARMEEMKANHNFQMLKQSIEQGQKTATEKLNENKALKAKVTEAMGKAEGELSDVKKTKLTDEMFVETLKRECQNAAAEWEERERDAKGEMTAIGKAVDILSDRVKVFTQGDGDYLDGSSAAADADSAVSPARHQLVESLRQLGHKFNSYALAELAGAAAADPFEKVRTLISDMIAKLTAEANEEADQKAFCDEEMAKSTKVKNDKSMRSDELQNRLDTASSTIARLNSSIKDLQEELAKADEGTKETTRIRATEQATNLKDMAEYQDATQAVAEATRVLKEYYASTAALLQSSKKGPGGAAGVIIGFLENIGAEFSKLYMEIKADELEAKNAFDALLKESEASKAAKKAEIKSAESEIKGLEVSLQENGEDLKMVNKELDTVLTYIEKLKPQCETKVMSFSEKVARRNAEIEGLKEALAILDEQ